MVCVTSICGIREVSAVVSVVVVAVTASVARQ